MCAHTKKLTRGFLLMLEVPEPGKHHSHSLFIAIVNRVLILYGAPRLDDGLNSLFVRNFHAVGEREKCVRSHDRTL